MPLVETLLEKISSYLRPVFPREGEERTKEIEKRLSSAIVDYDVKEISLTTAQTDEEYTLSGESLSAWTDGTMVGISVKLNTKNAPSIPLRAFRQVRGLFGKVYLTWTAQSGRTLHLLIGRTLVASDAPMAENYPLNLLAVIANSTTVLGDGATYTGAQFWCANYGWIVGSVFSDRAGTLYIDQSNDGTNYDVITEISYSASSTSGGFKVAVVGRYARVRFTNSAGGAQATFRIYYNTRSM